MALHFLSAHLSFIDCSGDGHPEVLLVRVRHVSPAQLCALFVSPDFRAEVSSESRVCVDVIAVSYLSWLAHPTCEAIEHVTPWVKFTANSNRHRLYG
jgi:hypothetical protein